MAIALPDRRRQRSSRVLKIRSLAIMLRFAQMDLGAKRHKADELAVDVTSGSLRRYRQQNALPDKSGSAYVGDLPKRVTSDGPGNPCHIHADNGDNYLRRPRPAHA